MQSLPHKKLPLWDMFREAVGFAWDHRRVLWGWIVVGALLAGLGGGLFDFFEYGEEGGGLTGLQYFAVIFLPPIPSLLVFVLLAVYCHRTFLIHHGGKDLKIRLFSQNEIGSFLPGFSESHFAFSYRSFQEF